MAINYVSVFFVTIFFGIECRSIVSSNLNQAVEDSENRETSKRNFLLNLAATTDVNEVTNVTNVNREFVEMISKDFPEELNQLIITQGLTVEKLLSEFIARAVNITNREDTATQWLEQLKLILDELASGIPIGKSSINEINDFGKKESTLNGGNKNFILIGGNNWLEDLQEILDEQYIDTGSSEGSESDDESTSIDSSTLHSLINDSSEDTEDGLLEQYDSEESDDVDTELENDISGTQKPLKKLCRKHRTST